MWTIIRRWSLGLAPDGPIYQIQFSDPDLDPTQLNEMPFIFEIAIETRQGRRKTDSTDVNEVSAEERVRRHVGSGSEHFQINQFGEV